MKRKNIFRFGLVVILLAGILAVIRSSAGVGERSSCCKESMDQCREKTNNYQAPGGMIWETLTSKFFSLTPCP